MKIKEITEQMSVISGKNNLGIKDIEKKSQVDRQKEALKDIERLQSDQTLVKK